MDTEKENYELKCVQIRAALKALALEKYKNGSLTKEQEHQEKELKERLVGYEYLMDEFGKSYAGEITNVDLNPKHEPTKMVVKKKRGPRASAGNFPVIYSPSLTQKQKMYCLLNELGQANYKQLRDKIQEYEPGVYNDLQLTKMVEIGMLQLNKLGKLESIKEDKKPRVYSIKKDAEVAA